MNADTKKAIASSLLEAQRAVRAADDMIDTFVATSGVEKGEWFGHHTRNARALWSILQTLQAITEKYEDQQDTTS